MQAMLPINPIKTRQSIQIAGAFRSMAKAGCQDTDRIHLPFLARGATSKHRAFIAASLSALAGWLGSQPAHAGAVIFNNAVPSSATVALGVNDLGHLNFSSSSFNPINTGGATGLSYKFPDGSWRDATAPGCYCEGWGLALTLPSTTRVSGYGGMVSGSAGLTLNSFFPLSTAALSQVSLTAAPDVTVSHDYSAVVNGFKGKVTVKNTSATDTVTDVVYRRAMDWDVPPTEFSEFVSHYGVVANLTSNGGKVLYASDNGFASPDPQTSPFIISPTSVNTDFVDLGPTDHGSVFDFAFGNLTPGASLSFDIFYGAYPDEATALADLPSLGLNVISLGQSNKGPYSGVADNNAPTFAFGFGGVGDVKPFPAAGPGPLPLVGCGAGLGWSRVLRRRIKNAKAAAEQG